MDSSGLAGGWSSRPRGAGYGPASVGGEASLMGLLGLPAADQDPVAIITAAQVRLRRWRRALNTVGHQRVAPRASAVSDRIRRIAAARDTLLRQAFHRNTSVGRN